MASYLFFDDQRLLVREGFTREVGQPQLIPDSVYSDVPFFPNLPHVWQENEHSFHLFYQSFLPGGRTPLLAAHSEDGIHFSPRNSAREAGIENPVYENQLIPGDRAELAAFIDTGVSPGRLKLLVSEYASEADGSSLLAVLSKTYVSDDGIHWTLSPHSWHNVGTEPCASLLYSKPLDEYVLLCRPMWGVRRICETRTKNFEAFTPPAVAMQADTLDPPLAESYGLTGFPYKDMFVGVLLLYVTEPSDTWKYMEGTLDGRLAYSFDGAHWMRCVREPIMPLKAPYDGMIFTSDMRIDTDGSILLYTGGTCRRHGHFAEPGGAIAIYRLREDGFVCLKAEANARLRTRETLLQGKFTINLQAEQATCALFTGDGQPIEGFAHEDCIPFSGDDTHWIPAYQSGKPLPQDAIVTIEIRMSRGRLYGISGDFVKMTNTESWRYARHGLLPVHTNP